MRYLFNKAFSTNSDEDEWKKIIAEYMAEYEKATLRVKPFIY